MKCLVILSCLLVAVYGIPPELIEQFKQHMLKIGGECKVEVSASDDDIAPLMDNQPPASTTAKCFLACVHKKMNFQDASGKIDKEGTFAWLEKLKGLDEELYGKMKTVVDTCLAEIVEVPDACENAAIIYDCVKKQEKVVGVPVLNLKS